MDDAALITALTDQAASNRELADAIRLQTLGLHALADAIAAPMDDEVETPRLDEGERYLDGSPVGEG